MAMHLFLWLLQTKTGNSQLLCMKNDAGCIHPPNTWPNCHNHHSDYRLIKHEVARVYMLRNQY